MAIALSHGGSNVYGSSAPSAKLLVGTWNGVAILERADLGSPWRLTHRGLHGLHVSSLIIEKESGTIFAGAFHDTVHASTDGGLTWERRDRGLTLKDIYSLAATSVNGGVKIYCGTEPAHLFYSDDLGFHWAELPALRSVPSAPQWSFPAPPHIAHTKFITFDPHDSAIIYACIEQGALLKSTDGGRSWSELNTLGFLRDKDRPPELFYDIHKALIDPRNSQTIYVTGGAGFYVTFNGGERWERWMSPDWAPDVYPDGLVFNPRNPDLIFVSAAAHNPQRWRDQGAPGYSGSRIYRSKDAGRSWQVLGNGLPDRMRHEVGALCLEEWGNGLSVFAATTGGDLYASDDGGDSWSLIAAGLTAVSKKGHERLLSAEIRSPSERHQSL